MQRSCPKEHESAFTCSSLFMVNRRNAQPYYEHIQVFFNSEFECKSIEKELTSVIKWPNS
jgi:hypothetical protein